MPGRRIIIIFFLLLCAAMAGRCWAQPDTLLKFDRVETGIMRGENFDIFHKFKWQVNARLSDGSTVSFTTRRLDTLANLGRIDTIFLLSEFWVSPEIMNSVVALHYTLEGSIRVAINDSTVVTTGDFDHSSNTTRKDYIQDSRVWFTFFGTLQRLSVVYLPHHRTHAFELDLKIDSREWAESAIQKQFRSRDQNRGVAFYYLAFAIVFISLFVSAKEKTEYLYFALFCFFASASYILSTENVNLLYNLEGFAGIFSFEFLAIFFCKVLLGRQRSNWPLRIILLFFCICLIPAVRYGHMGSVSTPFLLFGIYFSLYAYVIGASLFYLVRGVGKKQWQAKVIVTVCLIPVIIFVFVFVATLIFVGIRMSSNDPHYVNILPMMASYLAKAIVYVYPLSAVYIVGKRNMMTQRTLQEQIVSIGQLSEDNLLKEKEKQHILEHQKEDLERQVAVRTAEVVAQKEEIERQHSELKVEKKKSDDLLRNILPEEVASELKTKGHTEAKLFDNVSVLFTDFVNFTVAGELMTPQQLVDELHACFKVFDEITVKYELEKIKTIGDAYLAVCGLPVANDKHAEKVVAAAKEINAFMQQRLAERGSGSFNIRIGIHSGPVVAGIVGVKKFAYDVWGDTVNTAARLEQKGEPGKINISQSTYELVKGAFTCEYRGEIAAKNKGPMKMYFVQ